MCGILGAIDLQGGVLPDENKFVSSLNLMAHRGPDCGAISSQDGFIFGHRRLSIIDLNKNASQPMLSKCRNVTLTFNGEIYNYIELRKKLQAKGCSFETDSDTEVLLNLYLEYGIECLDMINGMFAFAIADNKNNSFYVARDRLGIKPLYYMISNKALLFSSEIKSILSLNCTPLSVNTAAISSYFSFRYPVLNDSFYNEIVSLAPGHFLRIKENKVSLKEYWDCRAFYKEQEIDRGEEYYIENLKNLLESSVKLRMRSDVPKGAFLSGGVDSSVVCSLMDKYSSKDPLLTYSIGFHNKEFDEYPYIHQISTFLGTTHEHIILDDSEYLSLLERLIKYKDAPLSVPNEVPLYILAKKLKEKITVVLSGEGADEILGGYGRIFRSAYDFERISKSAPIGDGDYGKFQRNFNDKYGVPSFKAELDHFMNIYSYIGLEEKKKLLNPDMEVEKLELRLRGRFSHLFDRLEGSSYLNKMMYSFEKVHLVGLLQRLDMTTMANSVEGRVPFVDHRLVEFAATIPVKYKLKWNIDGFKKSATLTSDKISEVYDTPKYLLKKAFTDKIPQEVLYRKKMGFPVPLNKWMGSEFSNMAKDLLLSPTAKTSSFFAKEGIEECLSGKTSSGKNPALKLWMMMNLEIFLKNYD